MAKKEKANNKIVLESVNQFTVDQVKYLQRASKRTLYDVDVMKAQINVKPEDLEEAKEDLTVMHLINQFQFSLQASIYADKRDPSVIFDPALKARRVTEPERLQVYATTGDKFLNLNTKIVMEVISISACGTIAVMKHLNTMMTPSPVPIETIRKMIVGRVWERIGDND